MPPERELRQVNQPWESDRIGELSASVTYILNHTDAISDEDRAMLKTANTFVHHVMEVLRNPNDRQVGLRVDWQSAFHIAATAYEGDLAQLKLLLGGSMNVCNNLTKASPSGNLSKVELNRADSFFTTLARLNNKS